MGVGTILAYSLLVLCIIGTILVILSDEDGDTGKRVAWIIVVVVLPVVGILCYIVFGLNPRFNSRYGEYSRRLYESFRELSDERAFRKLFGEANKTRIREGYRELSVLLSHSNGTTVTDNNTVEIITSGRRKFDALVQDLENARNHIHMEYFYFRKDDGSRRIREILMRKAREGVKVRFIHENIANIDISPRYYNEMKKAGVEVVKFTKPENQSPEVQREAQLPGPQEDSGSSTGKIGYTGGMNIGDDYFVRWRDTHMRITGNAVYALQYSFLYSFLTSGGAAPQSFKELFPDTDSGQKRNELVQIVPDQPNDRWPVIQMGAVWTVQHSRKYVYIQTPYFVPPEPLLQALKSAALKGADVRIMIPRKTDHLYMDLANKAYYSGCLEAGVRIFEKKGSFIHSKTIVSDDYLSVIGSANMDYRSLSLNYEINAYIFNEATAVGNRESFHRRPCRVRRDTMDSWARRPWYLKLAQAVMRLFAPLL